MNVSLHTEPFHYLLMEDVYTSDELGYIWQELEFLNQPGKFLDPAQSGGAREGLFTQLKNNKAIFLDSLYQHHRPISNILRLNRKTLPPTCNQEESWFFNTRFFERDFTMVSYYEDNGYYKPHHDKACITILTWLYKEPKKFMGGDLSFPDFNLEIPVRSNYAIAFPSHLMHAVSDILPSGCVTIPEGMGRYCITQFLHTV